MWRYGTTLLLYSASKMCSRLYLFAIDYRVCENSCVLMQFNVNVNAKLVKEIPLT